MSATSGRKLAAARVWATARMPYLASAIFACEIGLEPGSGTFCAERGWRLRADPEVVARLEVDELGRLIVHLVAHLIRDHAGRAEHLGIPGAAGGAAHWNRSADAEINDDLLASGCRPEVAGELPADLDCEPRQLAEHYHEHGSQGPRRWDCGSGADGCPRPGDGDGRAPAHAGMLRLAAAAEIQRAEAQQPGTVPGGWLRWAESVLPSRVDWRRVLAAEIRSAVSAVRGMVDYSYRRPSRRAHLNPEVILPTLQRPVPDVAIVCDTSGSMHERLLARALAEVEGVLSRAGLRQQRVRVLAVDTDVHALRKVSRASQVVLGGGGGTDMGRGIEAAAALRPRPSIVIVLTDGFTPWPPDPPPGVRVVVGLLVQPGMHGGWDPPAWARTVVIDED